VAAGTGQHALRLSNTFRQLTDKFGLGAGEFVNADAMVVGVSDIEPAVFTNIEVVIGVLMICAELANQTKAFGVEDGDPVVVDI